MAQFVHMIDSCGFPWFCPFVRAGLGCGVCCLWVTERAKKDVRFVTVGRENPHLGVKGAFMVCQIDFADVFNLQQECGVDSPWCGYDGARHGGYMDRQGQDITILLNDQDAESSAELLERVYDQLRRIAQVRMNEERKDHTLQATALVHEVYAKLLGDSDIRWECRAHFFNAAAQAMRRILVDHARTKNAQKRGGEQQRVPMSLVDLAQQQDPVEILALEEAMRRLESEDERAAQIVSLRFYAGLSVERTALALGVSERTVIREWTYARARLFELLQGRGGES